MEWFSDWRELIKTVAAKLNFKEFQHMVYGNKDITLTMKLRHRHIKLVYADHHCIYLYVEMPWWNFLDKDTPTKIVTDFIGVFNSKPIFSQVSQMTEREVYELMFEGKYALFVAWENTDKIRLE